METFLVKDLLFAFQGIDGKYLSLSNSKKNDISNEKLSISTEVANVVNQLLSIGHHYSQIQSSLSQLKKRDTVLLNSLAAYIEQDLNEFHRLIAILENNLQNGESSEFSRLLTLKKLYAWTQEPLVKLSTTAALLKSLCNATSHPLTLLSEYSSHGDPYIRSFITSLMNHISIPFYGMIISWVTKGVVKDSDFFVKVGDENLNNWKSGFSFAKENVPNFIDLSLAKKVF